MVEFTISGMEEPGCKENYPLSIVAISILLTLMIYGIGAFLLSGFGILFAIAYLLFVLILEFRIISSHCVDCYYYGKTCAFGKGRISALFFGKGSPEKFTGMTLSWKEIVPDFLVFIIPVLAGIVLLIQGFHGLSSVLLPHCSSSGLPVMPG
jgi:hypothetical protein